MFPRWFSPFVAGASLCALSCADWIDVDPLDYGCRPVWVRDGGSCIDAEVFAHEIRAGMWSPGEEVMGFAFAAGDRHGLAIKGACGLARTDRDGGVRVFEADMRIESGSTSKMLTTVAALRVLELVDPPDGLSTVMNGFLPEDWEIHAALRDAEVTLEQLLAHRSGLVNTGGIGLAPVLRDSEWFRAQWVGSYHYANHNMDAAGFVTSYLAGYEELRGLEAEGRDVQEYDSTINMGVRDLHYALLMEHAVTPLGLDVDCIRFAAATQQVWLYADGRSQEGQRLPARTNCMTSGWLMSAPQWVRWVHGLQTGGLLSSTSLDRLNRWDAPWEALGWGGSDLRWRDHSGSYSPGGVGVRTMVGYRDDGLSVALVTNSKNGSNLTGTAEAALTLASAACQ